MNVASAAKVTQRPLLRLKSWLAVAAGLNLVGAVVSPERSGFRRGNSSIAAAVVGTTAAIAVYWYGATDAVVTPTATAALPLFCEAEAASEEDSDSQIEEFAEEEEEGATRRRRWKGLVARNPMVGTRATYYS